MRESGRERKGEQGTERGEEEGEGGGRRGEKGEGARAVTEAVR